MNDLVSWTNIDQSNTPWAADVRTAIDLLELNLPRPPVIEPNAIDDLTPDQGLEVLRAVRRTLLMQLLHQELHEHMMDDCGDYLMGATENWVKLYDTMFTNDFTNSLDDVKHFLRDFIVTSNDPYADVNYPPVGSDGEVRHDIFPNLGD